MPVIRNRGWRNNSTYLLHERPTMARVIVCLHANVATELFGLSSSGILPEMLQVPALLLTGGMQI